MGGGEEGATGPGEDGPEGDDAETGWLLAWRGGGRARREESPHQVPQAEQGEDQQGDDDQQGTGEERGVVGAQDLPEGDAGERDGSLPFSLRGLVPALDALAKEPR